MYALPMNKYQRGLFYTTETDDPHHEINLK